MSGTTEKKLNFVSVAAMYVGVIMGAGFASGRETWQFFGIFGDKAFYGVVIAAAGFAAIAYMIGYLAVRLNTRDMGRIVCFIDNRYLSEGFGYFMAVFLFTTIISMTAAGGSFLYQQFGVHRAIGGGIIAILVAATILGDFDRISRLFRYIVPVLFAVVIICCVLVILSDMKQSGATGGFKPSKMAPDWLIAAPLYVAYNMMGMIPMGATASLNAKSRGHALWGSLFGGLLLGMMILVLVFALQKDMAFSASLDLPMLGYSLRLSPVINVLYGSVLYVSIYSAATSVFYGFTTKLPEGPHRSRIILISILIGYLLGLVGFRNLVAYMYPIEGYFGLVVIFMITVNFFKVLLGGKKTRKKGVHEQYD